MECAHGQKWLRDSNEAAARSNFARLPSLLAKLIENNFDKAELYMCKKTNYVFAVNSTMEIVHHSEWAGSKRPLIIWELPQDMTVVSHKLDIHVHEKK